MYRHFSREVGFLPDNTPSMIQKALVFSLNPLFFVIRKGTFIWKKNQKTLIYSIYTHVHIHVSYAPLFSLSYEDNNIITEGHLAKFLTRGGV